ncbi:alpha/beta hydrolase [Flammeovirga sp. MY04]|uniref:alpha/beta hydrolase n=1 Tax=Flammeovirga sp. MY04 TaxID=1191459 RepID=UPI000826B67D|nr:alpha/beta hydrolase [Flammeovirga sp. MY04]ANQ52492.2 alpha/beta hydrolase [Flammeovirga sp. MY04]
MKLNLLLAIFTLCFSHLIFGQGIQPDEKITYKTVNDVNLELHIFKPTKQAKSKGAIIFFHGGGWNQGSPSAFYRQAKHFAERGLVVICPTYRLRKINGTTVVEAVEDAQSAVAYVRENAKKFGIKPNKIAIGGGSAGGHLAASTAFIPSLNKGVKEEEYAPNLLVLFNPVIDASKEGYAHRLVDQEVKAAGFKSWEAFSPRQNINKNFPATLIEVGDTDKVLPENVARNYQEICEKNGVECKLDVYKGAEHSFFNIGYGKKQGYKKGIINRWYFEALQEADNFLVDHKYLEGNVTIDIPEEAIYPIRK